MIRTDLQQRDHTPLDGLSDVEILIPTNGQALVYDSTSGTWKNGASAGGKGEFHIVFFANAEEVTIP